MVKISNTTQALRPRSIGINRVQANIVVLMFAFSVVSYFDRTIMSIAAPGIMRQFSLSEPQMGAIYTAFLVSYAAMNIPGGYLADRFGPRLVLTGVGLGAGVFTALTALGGTPGLGTYLGIFPAIFCIRFAMGLCTGPLYPTCARTMGNWIPRARHALVQGLVNGGAGLGGATSPLLFSWMITTYGWQASFCIAAGVTMLLALIWYAYVRDHPPQEPRFIPRVEVPRSDSSGWVPNEVGKPSGWRQLLTNPHLLLLAVSCFTVNYFDYVYFFWIYYYLGNIRHFSQAESALATTVIFLTGTVMCPLGGWLSDRFVQQKGEKKGRRIVPILSLTLSAILLAVGINFSSKVATVALLSLSLGFALFADAPYWAAAIRLGGKQVGAACGILNTGANFGGVAPYVAPLIASRFGWAWGWYSASLILMFAVISWFFIDPTKSSAPVEEFHAVSG
jgi:MFS transporter, ACS family, glucarate transporter